MTIERILYESCVDFWNALRGDSQRSRASSRSDYKRLMSRGYGFVAGGRPTVARQYLNTACIAQWGEIERAATIFSSQVGIGQNGKFGTMDFMGVSWKLAQLEIRISEANGHWVSAPRPGSDGFSSLNRQQIEAGQFEAETWRIAARRVPNQADFAGFNPITTSMRSFYQDQVDAAKNLYVAALGDINQLVPNARTPYINALHSQPWNIWRAYKCALFPSQRVMAERLSMSVLTGHDPYSTGAPPRSAIRSLLGSMGQGLAQPFR